MSEAFWWYVLAGFLLGFSVSTLWEWLYFRRRRMTIRDRRIAELEATVRAYGAATAPSNDTTTDDWTEPAFQNPGVYLETEEPPPPTPRPDTLPPAQSPLPATSVLTAASVVNGAHAPMAQPASAMTNTYVAYSSPAPAGFQSLAVQQSAPSLNPGPPEVTPPEAMPPAEEETRLGSTLALASAVAVAQRMADASPPVAVADEDHATPPPTADAATPAPAYVNGVTGTFVQEGVGSLVTDHDPRIITRAEIGVLVSSINELIDTVSQEQKDARGAASLVPAEIVTPEADGPYVTRINGRTEYVLVRMVQSLMRFMRELRGILTGGSTTAPAIRPAPADYAGDDLTQIAGLSAEQAARLRTAGVTTYARLAALSPDELRMITLTPGGANADPAQWQTQAVQLAAAIQQEGAHP